MFMCTHESNKAANTLHTHRIRDLHKTGRMARTRSFTNFANPASWGGGRRGRARERSTSEIRGATGGCPAKSPPYSIKYAPQRCKKNFLETQSGRTERGGRGLMHDIDQRPKGGGGAIGAADGGRYIERGLRASTLHCDISSPLSTSTQVKVVLRPHPLKPMQVKYGVHVVSTSRGTAILHYPTERPQTSLEAFLG